MSLSLSVLLEELDEYSPQAPSCDADQLFSSVMDLPAGDQPLRDDILYLLPEASRLPALSVQVSSPAKPLCFAIPADEAGDLPLNTEGCRFLLLSERDRFPAACLRLQELFSQQAEWDAQLADAFSRDASLERLLDAARFDGDLTLLVWDTKLRLRALSPMPPLATLPERYEVIGRLRGASLRSGLENALGLSQPASFIVASPDGPDSFTALVAPLHAEGKPVLFAAVLTRGDNLSALNRFRFLALLEKLKLVVSAHCAPVENGIDGEADDKQPVPPLPQFEDILQPVCCSDDSPYHLYVIRFEEYLPAKAKILLGSLRRFMPSDPVIPLGDQICILNVDDSLFHEGEEAERRFNTLLVSSNTYCGISKRLRFPQDCRTAYDQARIALIMGYADHHPMRPECRFFYYGEYAEMHALAMYAQNMGSPFSLLPARLNNFYQDSLRDGTNIRMLHIFLNTGMSPSATAKALNIHRNTVVYRLNRMKEDYGIDLSNADCLRDTMRMLTIARYYRHYGNGNPLNPVE